MLSATIREALAGTQPIRRAPVEGDHDGDAVSAHVAHVLLQVAAAGAYQLHVLRFVGVVQRPAGHDRRPAAVHLQRPHCTAHVADQHWVFPLPQWCVPDMMVTPSLRTPGDSDQPQRLMRLMHHVKQGLPQRLYYCSFA